jgi:hypothetical protein
MTPEITVIGVVVGILAAVILTAKKVSPAAALFLGSIIGSLVGGAYASPGV